MNRPLDHSSIELAPGRPLLDRLMQVAAARTHGAALQHKDRGRWLIWRWRGVVDEVDRIAAGLRKLGLTTDSTLAIAGEIRPHLVLATLAAKIIGARILSVPRGADRSVLGDILGGEDVSVVVTQGRGELANWLKAAVETGARTRIVFDHVTADGHSPHPDVITFAALRALGGPSGWADELPAAVRRRSAAESIWIEETTEWSDGLETVVAAWLAQGAVLMFPEILVAAVRDRRQARPSRWIVSARQLAAASRDIDARCPDERNLTGRLIAHAISDAGRGGGGRFVAALLRRRLGLYGLTRIELFGAHAPVEDELRRRFQGLGLSLQMTATPSRESPGPSAAIALQAAEPEL
jgi:hypothetical protein